MKRKIISPLLIAITIVLLNICVVIAQNPSNPFDWSSYDHNYYWWDYYYGCYAPFQDNQSKSSALLSSGDLIVAGTQTFDNNHNDPIPCYTRIAVSRYNASGQITAGYFSSNTAPGSSRDVIQIVATVNDDIYLLGTNQYGNVIIKLNSALNEQWKFTIPQKSEIFIDADNGGNLIMAYTQPDTASVSGKVIVLKKYSAVDGSVIYTKWLKDSKDANIGSLRGLKVDESDNTYLCGSVNSVARGSRYLTAKFNDKGNYEWSRYYDGQPFATNDVANALVIDHNQNVIVTGESFRNITNIDVATIKYNSNGVLQWTKRSDNDSINNGGYIVKVDVNDNLYVAGYVGNDWYSPKSFLLKYNSNGNQIKKRNFLQTAVISIAVNSQGICYVGGYKHCDFITCPNNPQATFATLIKINTSGGVEWTYDTPYNGYESGNDEYFNRVIINNSANEAWITGAQHIRYQLDHSYYWTIAHISTASRMAENFKLSDALNIYPNPVTNTLQIQFKDEITDAQLTVLDLQGREVMNRTIISNDTPINVSELKAGVYFVRIIYEGNVITKKFVKE